MSLSPFSHLYTNHPHAPAPLPTGHSAPGPCLSAILSKRPGKDRSRQKRYHRQSRLFAGLSGPDPAGWPNGLLRNFYGVSGQCLEHPGAGDSNGGWCFLRPFVGRGWRPARQGALGMDYCLAPVVYLRFWFVACRPAGRFLGLFARRLIQSLKTLSCFTCYKQDTPMG